MGLDSMSELTSQGGRKKSEKSMGFGVNRSEFKLVSATNCLVTMGRSGSVSTTHFLMSNRGGNTLRIVWSLMLLTEYTARASTLLPAPGSTLTRGSTLI